MAIEKPIFCVPVDLGTIACDNHRPNALAKHLNLHKSPGLVWRSYGDEDLWVRGEFPAEQVLNICSLINANAQAGTQIRLRLGASAEEVNGDEAEFDSGEVDFISPAETTDGGAYHSLLRFPDVAAKWWRIDITGHDGDFEAMSLIMGNAIQTERYYDKGWEIGSVDLGDIELSRWGVASESEGLILRRLNFSLSWLSEAEFKSHFRHVLKQSTRKPVFILFDPQEVAGRQEQFYFGRFAQPPFAMSGKKAGRFTMEFSMVSMI